ncbi:MAG: aminopeptidase P N-terminal domain-containing protein [Myxococcales bacterium]|nr:aminopeptidase P N-terminal domain-containing protein [Myxococcales bacterium]
MISTDERQARRETLSKAVGRAILLMGNDEQPRNLPMVALPFRQDSSFLYYTGCDEPGAAALIRDGECTLFLHQVGEGDALWHGPTPTIEQRAGALGVSDVRPADELAGVVASTLAEGPIATMAVSDPGRTQLASWWSNRALAFGAQHGDDDLVDCVIAQRRTKSAAELAELRAAASHSAAAHIAVAQAARPGATERGLAAIFEGVLAARGCVPGYGTILSRRGEILHNRGHAGTLTAGDLLLVDGGGEVGSGYTADITRTWPVGGPLNGRQLAAYEAILQAQTAAIDLCRVGVRYREVHDAASRVLATFLRDVGILNCDEDEALETGAHGLFYPHGTGHLIGLDVHDLENFGDRPSYPADRPRPTQFGTRSLRLDLPLEAGWVVTVEPGLYAVPDIIYDAKLRVELGDRVNWKEAERWVGFGGIRIEDDIAITAGAPENLSWQTPKSVDALKTLVGSGPTVEQRLGVVGVPA